VDLVGSQGHVATAPTTEAELDLQKNGSSIGTITFAASSNSAAFTFPDEVTFAAGDRLAVIAPASPDPSLADIALTFNGRRI
jgi:hypothetical protein